DPILRLLKQARAFGIGLILATQNPGDLDYKGLTNAGTWFIGRLQSANDQKRVMAGLESLATAENNLNMQQVGRLIADIEPRVFLMHNVHDTGGPILVHTRWAMSYLRGPLTRQQVGILMADQRRELAQKIAVSQPVYYNPVNQPVAVQAAPVQNGMVTPPATLPGLAPPPTVPGFTNQAAPQISVTQANPSQAVAPRVDGFLTTPPPLPSSIVQYFVPHAITSQQAMLEWQQRTGFTAQGTQAVLAYQPVLLAQAAVRFQDRKTGVYTARYYSYRIPDLDKSGLIRWEDFQAPPLDARSLSSTPLANNAIYGDPPAGLTDPKRVSALKTELTDMLYNAARLIVPFNPTLKIYGDPNADVGQFYTQSAQVARELRDAEIDKVTSQFEKVIDKLEDRRDRKARELSAEQKELADRRREETFTKGEALLSLLRG